MAFAPCVIKCYKPFSHAIIKQSCYPADHKHFDFVKKLPLPSSSSLVLLSAPLEQTQMLKF